MKLSVMMVTYKHERFIAQAIESVLMQRADFPFEIVIGEDHSPDGTGKIVAEYARRYPEKIRLLAHPTNLGANENFIRTFQRCSGDYIAILDGDDYWTDPEKLQLQANALDANPQWAICFHTAGVLEDGQKMPSRELPALEQRKPSYSLQDILQVNMIQTPTAMFRNHLFPEFPRWMRDLPMVDWPLHALNARAGEIGFIDRTMAVYRQHAGGIWTAQSTIRRIAATQRLYQLFAQHVAPQHRAMLNRLAAITAGQLALEYANEGEFAASRKHLNQYLWQGGWRQPSQRRQLPKLIYQCYLRGLLPWH